MNVPTPFRVVLLGPDQQRLARLGSLFDKSRYRVTLSQNRSGGALRHYNADAIVLDASGLATRRGDVAGPLVAAPLLVVGTGANPWPDEQQLVLQVAVLCRRGRVIKDGLKALGVQLSPDRRTVTSEAGAEAVLTPVEFALLRGIVMGAGEVVPRDRLARMAWQGQRRIAHATFDSHIRGVRARLRAAGIPLRIRTCRGSGYAWVLPA